MQTVRHDDRCVFFYDIALRSQHLGPRALILTVELTPNPRLPTRHHQRFGDHQHFGEQKVCLPLGATFTDGGQRRDAQRKVGTVSLACDNF